MDRTLVLLLAYYCVFLAELSEAQDAGLEASSGRSVEACLGQPVQMTCTQGGMVRVVQATYQQSEACPGGLRSPACGRPEMGNPICVGNTSCVFPAPWVYLSPICGYSNSFTMIFECLPGK